MGLGLGGRLSLRGSVCLQGRRILMRSAEARHSLFTSAAARHDSVEPRRKVASVAVARTASKALTFGKRNGSLALFGELKNK